MTRLQVAKIKIFSKIVRKLEPSIGEYDEYEKNIRQAKLDSNIGYNAALGFVVLSRAINRTLDYIIVLMIRLLLIIVVMSIITISYG